MFALLVSLILILTPMTEPDYASVQDTTVYLGIKNEDNPIKIAMMKESKGGGCSATKIAPHTLLTNAHCAFASDVSFWVDGTKGVLKGTPIFDTHDHMLLTFTNLTFAHTAPFAKITPKVGKLLFFYGNPAGLNGVLRVGRVASYPDPGVIMIDINGWHGDSGAGVFNENGEIVTTVMSGFPSDEKPDLADGITSFKLTVGLNFNFEPQVALNILAGKDPQ